MNDKDIYYIHIYVAILMFHHSSCHALSSSHYINFTKLTNHITCSHDKLRAATRRCRATCSRPCRERLVVEESSPNMTTFVRDKLTNVTYCSSDGLMVNLFPLPPPLGFLQLPPALVESPTSPEVLTSIVSTQD
jgi:hypothetical protein